MTDEQKTALEALGCTVATAQEGDGWSSLFVQGEGVSAYILESDDEAAQQLIDGLTAQTEAPA